MLGLCWCLQGIHFHRGILGRFTWDSDHLQLAKSTLLLFVHICPQHCQTAKKYIYIYVMCNYIYSYIM